MAFLNIDYTTWKKAFVIGVLGSFIMKGLELLGQLYFGWSSLTHNTAWSWQVTLIWQLVWVLVWSIPLTILILYTSDRLWTISFVPMLYYALKETMNIIQVYHHFIIIPYLESLIGLIVGVILYFSVEKFWRK